MTGSVSLSDICLKDEHSLHKGRIDTCRHHKSDNAGYDQRIEQAGNNIGPDQQAFVSVGTGRRADGNDVVDTDHIADGAAHVLQGYDQDLIQSQDCRDFKLQAGEQGIGYGTGA